jgi:ATP-dependent Clp protease protease subunit
MKIQKLLQLLRDNTAQARKPLNLVRNEATPSEATLYVYDVIDPWWGVSALAVAEALAGLDASTTLHVRINSPGGDVFEGRAIRTHLAQFPGKVIAHVDGLAASAATTVADGADEIEIVDGGFYMIHNGWTLGYGNRHELRKTADLLEKVDQAIVADYARRTGLEVEQLAKWMDDETWFSADEAVEHGFATRKAAAERTDAKDQMRWNLAAYDKAPKALTDPVQTPAPEPDYAALHAHNARRLQVLAQFA